MRARTLAISMACHAAVGIGIASLATHDGPGRSTATTTIELVDAPPAPPPPPISARADGGSLSGEQRAAPRLAARSVRARASRDVARSDANPRGALRVEDMIGGDIGIDAGVVSDGDGIGGRGGGSGRGFGLGEGAAITRETVTVVPPPAPAASKARTAKLVYPVREREVDDSELFIARVTIDDEGYVVGAKLVRGFGGPRDAMAADLIWKFRYAPALDDEGRPIRSTFEQRFLVGR